MAPRFEWVSDQITPALQAARSKATAYLSKTATYHSLLSEEWAKVNAPWTDQTANARSGLVTRADNSRAEQGHWEIIVAHSVPYGIWLELRFAGKYAVIMPTIRHQAPMFFGDAQDVLDRMFAKG